MELGIHDIIKGHILTPKSVKLYGMHNKLTLEVHDAANRTMVRDAVEKIWGVKVEKVSILRMTGKIKYHGRKRFAASDKKKAIITLKKGYKIDLPGQFESIGATPSAEVETERGA